MSRNILSFLFILTMVSSSFCFAQEKNLNLWYTRSAKQWEETVPLGNGRLGMMPDGNVINENIVLNEISLWSGGPQDANNYGAYKRLPEVRRLILEGKNDEAQVIINKDFICKGAGSGNGNGADVPFGSYQLLADLHLKFQYAEKDSANLHVENYKRGLSLKDAIATCSYTINGVHYTREYFTSFGDDVDMIRVSADKPGQLNFRVAIDRPERYTTKRIGDDLEISGRLKNGSGGNGMAYMGRVSAKIKDGRLTGERNELIIEKATEVILYVSAKTNWHDPDYVHHLANSLAAAKLKSYDIQKQQHTRNYKKLFSRVSIDLGITSGTDLPTDLRLLAFQKNPIADPGVPALFFQYGRYLLISSIRVGLLPPNLQGLWANQVQTPWNSDYHLDLNIQMCHWPVEVANLPELDLPLTEYVRSLMKNGEKSAKAYYNADGWIAHVCANVWGFTEPGESANWGFTKVGPGWLCDNLWQHYQFTGDDKYLESIYPILKGAAEFYSSVLVRDPKSGWLVTSPSSSPENSFYLPNGKMASICMGPTVDNQIVRELFTNTIYAASRLKIDQAFKTKLSGKLKQIPPPVQIAKDGRVMEWMEDYKETEPTHRHISHLYGLYPAPLITPEANPSWAEACKKTLEGRGDDGTGWSVAYKMLFWSRLHNGDRAFNLFTTLMRMTLKTGMNYGAGGGVYPNLLGAGPPFQIDGNLGGTAAIAEMLIQSHAGFIDLLPALPGAWKAHGEIKGFKARGNYTVDMVWNDGKVTHFKISSPFRKKVKVRSNGKIESVNVSQL
jgi:alpha-L-fucosidase 2